MAEQKLPEVSFEPIGNVLMLDDRFVVPCAFGGCPDGVWKVRVVLPTGNNMPVNMRHNISQACQIDFVWVHQLAQNGFGDTNGLHDRGAMLNRQVGHLGGMRIEDNPAQTGPRRVICVNYPI